MKKKALAIAMFCAVTLMTGCAEKEAQAQNEPENKEAGVAAANGDEVYHAGSWNDDKSIYTTYTNVELTADEYDKLLCKTQDKDMLDILSEDMIDTYLYKNDASRNDLIKLYFQDITWNEDIKFSFFDFNVNEGSGDYKVIAKASLPEKSYNTLKAEFSKNSAYPVNTVEEIEKLLQGEDKSRLGDIAQYTVYGGAAKVFLKVTDDKTNEADGVKAVMFNDNTGEICIYYYNPLLEERIYEL